MSNIYDSEGVGADTTVQQIINVGRGGPQALVQPLPTRQPGTTRVPKLQDRIPPPQEQMLDPVQQILDAGKMQASQEVQRMQQAPALVASATLALAPA